MMATKKHPLTKAQFAALVTAVRAEFGRAAAANMTPEQRTTRARNAVNARWAKAAAARKATTSE